MVASLQIASITHEGLAREHNEDCLVIGRLVCNSSTTKPLVQTLDVLQSVLCMVADGVGGQAAGEVASQYVCRRMAEMLGDSPTEESLSKAIIQVHTELYAMMKREPRYTAMGSTIAGIVFAANRCLVFNVGDSRVWRVQSGYLAQISVDDIAVGARGGSITQCLGGTPDYTEILPHIAEEKSVADRTFLICSDGLTDMLSLDEIEARLNDDPVQTVESLFATVMDRGAKDNVSIICVRCE